ncbi:unnamed protein product [Moneuplotes crassus]|uniref:Uncharacterized protein n=1 Tax=Euplotes crassus TaxID=5936 RepID=A0AAD1UAX8_EUPCR|nr:unnamed protein product [Moneuplotes crassus]
MINIPEISREEILDIHQFSEENRQTGKMDKRTQSLANINPRKSQVLKEGRKETFLPSFSSKTPKLTPFQKIKMRKISGRKVLINRNFSSYKNVQKFPIRNKFPKNLSIKKTNKMLISKKAHISDRQSTDSGEFQILTKPAGRSKYSISRYIKQQKEKQTKVEPREEASFGDGTTVNFHNIKIRRKTSNICPNEKSEMGSCEEERNSYDQYSYRNFHDLKSYGQSIAEVTSRNRVSLDFDSMPNFKNQKRGSVQVSNKRVKVKQKSVDYSNSSQRYLKRVRNSKKLFKSKHSIFEYSEKHDSTQESPSIEKSYSEAFNWNTEIMHFNDKKGQNLSFSKGPCKYSLHEFKKSNGSNELSSDGSNLFSNLKLIGDFRRKQGKSFFVSKRAFNFQDRRG